MDKASKISDDGTILFRFYRCNVCDREFVNPWASWVKIPGAGHDGEGGREVCWILPGGKSRIVEDITDLEARKALSVVLDKASRLTDLVLQEAPNLKDNLCLAMTAITVVSPKEQTPIFTGKRETCYCGKGLIGWDGDEGGCPECGASYKAV